MLSSTKFIFGTVVISFLLIIDFGEARIGAFREDDSIRKLQLTSKRIFSFMKRGSAVLIGINDTKNDLDDNNECVDVSCDNGEDLDDVDDYDYVDDGENSSILRLMISAFDLNSECDAGNSTTNTTTEIGASSKDGVNSIREAFFSRWRGTDGTNDAVNTTFISSFGWDVIELVRRKRRIRTYRAWISPVLPLKIRGGSNGKRHEVTPLSLSAIDRWTRSFVLNLGVIVALQSLASLLKAGDYFLFDELSTRLLSNESATAVKKIRKIMTRVHEHGVVDVFAKYPAQDALASVFALSRLQRASTYYDKHVRQQDQEKGNEGEKVNKKQMTESCKFDDPQLLNELCHYAVYANAAYGWTMDLAFRRRLNLGDLQTLLKKTGIERDDVLLASWESRTHCPAFFIVRDRQRRALVLCIRGTWSAKDVLTDLCCTAEEFQTPTTLFSPPLMQRRRVSHRAHHGMLQAARSVSRLAKEVIAEELKSHPDYSLVLVGHSMGGGVAALLGMLWKTVFANKMTIYAYGAPCVAPLDTARSMKDIMVNVVSEGDPFSCLSIGHVADISVALSQLCEDPELRSEILIRSNGRLKEMSSLDLEWCSQTLQTLRTGMSSEKNQNKMFPPGRIILLSSSSSSPLLSALSFFSNKSENDDSTVSGFEESDNEDEDSDTDVDVDGSENNNRSTISAREVQPSFFRELSISPRMFDVTRHVPSLYETRLHKLMGGAYNN